MRAMILAAGRGERMRPLTDRLPKPLLPAGGQPDRLAPAAPGRSRHPGHRHQPPGWATKSNRPWATDRTTACAYAIRPNRRRWKTAGGIVQALPLLGDAPFLVVNGDVWCDWQPDAAHALAADLKPDSAWLLLVNNPSTTQTAISCWNRTDGSMMATARV